MPRYFFDWKWEEMYFVKSGRERWNITGEYVTGFTGLCHRAWKTDEVGFQPEPTMNPIVVSNTHFTQCSEGYGIYEKTRFRVPASKVSKETQRVTYEGVAIYG